MLVDLERICRSEFAASNRKDPAARRQRAHRKQGGAQKCPKFVTESLLVEILPSARGDIDEADRWLWKLQADE